MTGVKRGKGKPSVWAKQNKGVDGRRERDQVQYERDTANQRDPGSVKAALERKAKIYDKIRFVHLSRCCFIGADSDMHRRGKTGGLDEAQMENVLVDFDGKESDSEESEEDESATVPVRPMESDVCLMLPLQRLRLTRGTGGSLDRVHG